MLKYLWYQSHIMTIQKNQLFKKLLSDFLKIDEYLEAVIVSDYEGFIIAGEKKESVDMELISVLTTLITPISERIRNEFSFRKFGTTSFDTEKNRLLFISIDDKTTLSIVLDPMGSIDKISPYAFFLAEKVSQIINADDNDVIQISIPNFEVEKDSSSSSSRIKDQIYQMRLDSGGKYHLKFIIVGDHLVGKSSILRRFVENKFSTDYRATIGLNVMTHSIEFYGNEIIFALYDVGAQEFFKRFRKTYYTGAQAAFIVFDLTNKTSFENVRSWLNEIQEILGKKDLPIVIVGNKMDLVNERNIKYEEAVQLVSQLAKEYDIEGLSYIETSALTGENINDAFNLIAYHYIVKNKELEEKRLCNNLVNALDSILEKKGKLTLTFISENPYWSPGFQILNEINSNCGCSRESDSKEERCYKYSNGLVLKNYTFENIKVYDSDGVFIIFDARNKNTIDPKWKEVIINVINDMWENRVALIGIRVTEGIDWDKLMEEFDINPYLEEKLVSILFFKLGAEYRLEIYDQLEVMFDVILNID